MRFAPKPPREGRFNVRIVAINRDRARLLAERQSDLALLEYACGPNGIYSRKDDLTREEIWLVMGTYASSSGS